MSCNVGKTKKDFVIAAVATVIHTILVHVFEPCEFMTFMSVSL